MTIEVAFDGGIQRANSNAGNHLWIIADLRGAQYQFVLEEVDVVVDAAQTIVGNGQGAGTSGH